MPSYPFASRYALADAQKIAVLAADRGLPGAVAAFRGVDTGKVNVKALWAFLDKSDWGWADKSTKRLVAQLRNYCAALLEGPAEYATDRRVQALSEVSSKDGRRSMMWRVNIAERHVAAAAELTPEQRGKVIEAYLESQK